MYRQFGFLFLLFLGSLVSLSSNNWLGIWIGMEINMMSFISIMMNKTITTNEASILYFLFQSCASILFLFCVFFVFINIPVSMIIFYFIQFSLLMKLGAAPLHFWMPLVMNNISLLLALILLTWQKLIPIISISYFMSLSFASFVLLVSSLVGSLGGLNQSSLMKLLAYSSINQISWMMSAILLNMTVFNIYFITYFMILCCLIILFHKMNIKNISQVFILNLKTSLFKIMMFLNMFSLGGLPPFIGFFSKMLLIKEMVWTILPAIVLLLTMMSCIILYYYMQMFYSCMLLNANILWGTYDIAMNGWHFFMIMFNFFSNLFVMLLFFMF